MPIKEFAALAGAGMGIRFITQCVVVLLFNIGFQFFYNFLYEEAKTRHEKAIEDARIEAERVEAEKKAHAAMLRAKKATKK